MFLKRLTFNPALSHPMGEGESHFQRKASERTGENYF